MYAACDSGYLNMTYDMRLTNDASRFPFTSSHMSYDRQSVAEVQGFVFGGYFVLSLLFSRAGVCACLCLCLCLCLCICSFSSQFPAQSRACFEEESCIRYVCVYAYVHVSVYVYV